MIMDKIRQVFHKISNQLNNISLTAGSVKEALRNSDVNQEVGGNIIEALARIEDNVSSLAGKLEELRSLIKSQEE